MLNKDQKRRYSRHLLLEEVGEKGQELLLRSKVLVVGAGGLGCPVLQYLVAAGVGKVGIIDFDTVDESNLQRQILFSEKMIGQNKAKAAKKRLSELNSGIDIQAYDFRLDSSNARELFGQYDIIVDGSDNFATRYLVNDACLIEDKPLVYGAIFKFEGQVSVFNYKKGPSYRCLFPDPPNPDEVPSCSEIGVLGVLPGLIGIQQANEVIKIILGKEGILSGRMLMINALESSFNEIGIKRNPKEVEKVLNRVGQFENTDYHFLCSPAVDVRETDVRELKERLRKNDLQIIDVREMNEEPEARGLETIKIPLTALEESFSCIDTGKDTVVMCRSGKRSIVGVKKLKQLGHFESISSLKGGVLAWLQELENE